LAAAIVLGGTLSAADSIVSRQLLTFFFTFSYMEARGKTTSIMKWRSCRVNRLKTAKISYHILRRD
jgi:hypothetical protein